MSGLNINPIDTSRDQYFDYGDYIVIEGAGDHSGVWQVRDTMNARWTKRLDFLMSINHKPFKYDNVVIRSYKQTSG